MPTLQRDQGVAIHYEVHGAGFPVLLLAPGGMRSSIPFWDRSPWHPIRELSSEFRLIAMDQRNAGRSVAPIGTRDGWDTYAGDQLALLDHLGVAKAHLIGGCIGGAFALKLLEVAPERVAAAVLQQPIGLSSEAANREVFHRLFDDWAHEVKLKQSDVPEQTWAAYRERMYGGDFTFSVSREFVRTVTAPLLVLMGNDVYHPSSISREVAELARNTQLIERWREPDLAPETARAVREFLQTHTPR